MKSWTEIAEIMTARGYPMGDTAVFVKQIPLNGRVSHDPSEWPEDLRVRSMPTLETAKA